MKQTCLLISLLSLSFFSFSQEKINPENITIIRDNYGVPHIYAPTDAEAAYGLAWACAEDDFESIQTHYILSKGKLSHIQGKKAAAIDYVVQLARVEELINEKYETDISPEFKKILNAYSDALNNYAANHPEEVLLKDIFPTKGKDILNGYVVALTVMSGIDNQLKSIISGDIKDAHTDVSYGSNAYAVNSKRSKDGGVYVTLNSHQPIEGPFSWYEAHVVSDEGMNIHGGLFPGGVSIFSGTNEHLSWAHTVNKVRLSDIYKLEMHPKKKNTYKMDGEWKELEVKKAKMKVKLFLGLKMPIPKKAYWSEYGPTMKTKHGVYAIRTSTLQDIRSAEQWHLMGKTKNLDEFKEVLNMQALAKMNIVYGDKDDNIFYISNGLVPKRDTSIAWKELMPGNTYKTLWTEYYPVSELPQVENPDCGYIFNTNNPPFYSTCESSFLNVDDFHYSMGFETKENNRSIRFRQRIEEFEELDFEDFKNLKYDLQFPEKSVFLDSISAMFNLSPEKYPEIAPSLNILNSWDRSFTADNEYAALFVLAAKNLQEQMKFTTEPFHSGLSVSEKTYRDVLLKSQKHLLKYYDKLKVPLGELQKHVRGTVELPIWGFPDVLQAMYSKDYEDGKLRAFVGDSYIQFAKYKDGKVHIETINAYGASNKAKSPHYTDQMEMFVNLETKTMYLDKESVLKNAELIYHPKGKAYYLKEQD